MFYFFSKLFHGKVTEIVKTYDYEILKAKLEHFFSRVSVWFMEHSNKPKNYKLLFTFCSIYVLCFSNTVIYWIVSTEFNLYRLNQLILVVFMAFLTGLDIVLIVPNIQRFSLKADLYSELFELLVENSF